MKILAALTLVLAVFALWGCGDADDTKEPDNAFWADPPSMETGCCGVAHAATITGTAPAGGAYYFLALMDQDRLVLRGDPLWLDEGAFYDEEIDIAVGHLDEAEAKQYLLRAYAVPTLEDVVTGKGRIIAKEVGFAMVPSYADSSCAVCCTRDPNDPNGERSRRHCLGARDVGDLIGVQADIRTRLGLLCGSGSSTETAQYNAFIYTQDGEIMKMNSGMVQAGYMRHRFAGSETDTLYLYLEWVAPGLNRTLIPLVGQFYFEPPDEGSDHNYRLEWDNPNEKWRFFYDNNMVLGIDLPEWNTPLGKWAAWSTEINRRETDMPGTASDPCIFGRCQFQQAGGNWTTITFTGATDTVRCSGVPGNPPEWNIHGSRDTLYVWDENPYAQP